MINQKEADSVRKIFSLYIEIKNVTILCGQLKIAGIRSKIWTSVPGRQFGGAVLSRGTIYHLLSSQIYIGKIIHKGVLHKGQHEAIIDMETWNRVATQLKQNQVRRRNPHNLPSGRVLYGKLVTPNGQTFTPTHASKKGRRYLYYTLAKTASKSPTDEIRRRLPATEVEAKVIACVSSLLEDSLRIAGHFKRLSVRELRMLTSAAKHRAAVLSEPDSKEGREFIRQILSKVIVLPSELQIDLSKWELGKELLGKSVDESGLIELREPLQVIRRGSEVRLILENGGQEQEAIPSLVRAVTQARTWSEWIIDGKVKTMRELAAKAGLNRHYASRILRLAALSPQLVDAVIRGEHSPVITLVSVTTDFPLEWELQKLA